MRVIIIDIIGFGNIWKLSIVPEQCTFNLEHIVFMVPTVNQHFVESSGDNGEDNGFTEALSP